MGGLLLIFADSLLLFKFISLESRKAKVFNEKSQNEHFLIQWRFCGGYESKDCVAIASDLRFGKELQMVTCDFSKCFEMSPHLWLGLTGLATDVQTVQQKMEFRKNMYELSESRTMKPRTFAAVLSNMLYERRFGPFFVNPVIAGL